jgi:hypothetical protein
MGTTIYQERGSYVQPKAPTWVTNFCIITLKMLAFEHTYVDKQIVTHV